MATHEPTGTNRSSGLIKFRCQVSGIRYQKTNPSLAAAKPASTTAQTQTLPHPWIFAGLVVMARDLAPDPIPNSAVKTLRADGTVAQATEE